MDSTECRYLLAGAGNGVVFAYDLEGAGRAADGESQAADAPKASAHDAEANGVLEPLFSTGAVLCAVPLPPFSMPRTQALECSTLLSLHANAKLVS